MTTVADSPTSHEGGAPTTLIDLACRIAAGLASPETGAWTVDPPDLYSFDSNKAWEGMGGRVVLRAPEVFGSEISVRADDYRGDGKLSIRPSYPRFEGSIIPYREEDRAGTIHVSQNRPVRQIVAEIRRRVLVKYLPTLAAANDTVARAEAARNRARALAEKLAALAGTEPHGQEKLTFSHHRGGLPYIKGTVSTSEEYGTELTIDYLPPDLAESVIRLVLGYTRE